MARIRPKKKGPRKVSQKRAERIAQALKLRTAGLSYDRIAELLNVSKTVAWNDVQDGIRLTMQEPADELRTLEVARLNEAQAAIWKRVLMGDTDAIRTVLQIMDRRARYTGIDTAPSESEVEGVKSLLEQLVEENE